jgi:hypothetical protein
MEQGHCTQPSGDSPKAISGLQGIQRGKPAQVGRRRDGTNKHKLTSLRIERGVN